MSDSLDTTREAERRYGDIWAEFYDGIHTAVEEDQIDVLVELVGDDRRALELAVGTGRVAIPLALRGVEVTGVDISEAMLDRLSERVGDASVIAVTGDMVDPPLSGTWPLAFVTFNSFFAISSQTRQVECFQNMAKHLVSGGRFVLDCFVPDMKRFDENNHYASVVEEGPDGFEHREASTHFPATQRVESQHHWTFRDGSTRTLPVWIRYAWPSELDLMAQMAGLELEDRWGWYDRSPFSHDSERHVSVYRKL